MWVGMAAAYLDLVGGVDRRVEGRVLPLSSPLSDEGLILRLLSLPEHDPGLGHHVEGRILPSWSLLTDEDVILRLSSLLAHDPGLGLHHGGQVDAAGIGRQRLNATGHQRLPGVALVKIDTYGPDPLPSLPVQGPRRFDLSS
jgi:hypothetical protein